MHIGLPEIEDLFITFGISSSRDHVIQLIYEVVYNKRKTLSQESRIISDFSGDQTYNFQNTIHDVSGQITLRTQKNKNPKLYNLGRAYNQFEKDDKTPLQVNKSGL